LSRQSANNNTPSPTPIVNGDGLCFVSRSGQITGIRANSCNSNTVTTTEKNTIPEGSVIYRNLNIAFERELEKNMPQRVIPVDLFMRKGPAGNLELVAEWGRKNEIKRYNCTIAVEGEFESASNTELAKANLFRQLGKNTGIFKFNLCAIDEDVEIPFIPIGQINGLRRALAEKIEAIIPTLWNGIEDNGRKPATAAADGKDGAVKLSGQKLNYLANCSNKISYNLYKRVGAAEVAPAYELEPVAQAELMRTKYCIKYELGLCPNWKVRAKSDPQYKNRIPQYQITEPLFLLNGRSRLELKFDCSNCQMLIIG
jgi:putative protease